ncbi:MAG: zinc metalloprotease HtpX [Cetobacterium sp.]
MQGFKTFILMLVMTFLLLFIGGAVGGRNGMTIALVFAGVMNFVSYWFSDKIVLSMYRAQELPENHKVYWITKKLSESAGLPMPKVYMINESQPNAFATGRNPHHAAVAVTRGLVELMDDNELSGVIAHELGHVSNRDILIQSVAATLAGAIAYMANMAKWAAIFGGRRRDDEDSSGGIFGLLAITIFAPLAAMLIQMAISRSREYKADNFGAKVSGNPRYLANALRKLESYSTRIPMDAVPATENMFIVSPLAGNKMASLFSTHPSTAERIKRLEEMN